MIPTHHHREPPTYREIGRSTLARYPGEPMPAWLRPTVGASLLRAAREASEIAAGRLAPASIYIPVHIFGETPTLPPYEDRT